MKKIALINCYFGEFPWYFPLFVKSCASNPTISFLIFSDANYEGILPDNICINTFSLKQFSQLATDKLGFEVAVNEAYKLCDFKPAYGFLFSEYLNEYDFWGMCDIDIVLGRIREFITNEILDTYDVISTRNDYLTGSFLLFRNKREITNLFTKSKDYQKVFTSDIHYCFDECNFKHSQLGNEISIFDVPCEIESMEHIIRKEYIEKNINVFYDFMVIDASSGKLKWDHGFLSYDNKFEILLYHLIQYKSNIFARKDLWTKVPNVFFIDKYMFREESTKSIIGLYHYFVHNKWVPFKSFLVHNFDFFLSKFFKPKYLDNVTKGVYKSKLGDARFYIDQNSDGESIFYFKESSNRHSKLIQSKFCDDFFYSNLFRKLKFKRFDSKNGKTKKIQLIALDGSVSNCEPLE